MKEKEVDYTFGLSAEEVLRSREEHGRNVLTPPRRRSMWQLYLEKYEDPIIRILLVAAVVSLVLACFNGEFVESVGIILAVFFATTVGFYFERDAARKFDVLTALGEEQPVRVVRDGTTQLIARGDVVVGDVVIVETGDEVPADGRLFAATDLQVDESSLTGEMLAEKNLTEEVSGAYASNLLLRSSMVMNGNGRYVVTAVGDETEIGHVAREATEITGLKTPLNMQLDRLAKLISKAGTAISVLAFVVFLVHDMLTQPLWHTDNYMGMAEVVLRYFMMAVTLIVMAVPEGLPMAVTLALALNMRRMLKSNIFVRKLQASETMGAVTVICTDKTGTLTQNRMTVASMLIFPADDDEAKDTLARAIALNTTAELGKEGQGIGNPTEVALLRWLTEGGRDYKQLREETAITDRLPFSTDRKYMSTRAGRQVFVKGAPEMVMAICRLEGDEATQAQQALDDYQQHAMRTLAFAYGESTDESSEPATYRLQAVCGISDPVRDDVPGAMELCREAGIGVKIVTGDTTVTAREIGRQIGLDGLCITGQEFEQMSDDEAAQAALKLCVMSRARPHNKQRLVELLQQQGQVVAVTGDGTNDAPALNHAHVGLSLGSGTSVAKRASDITLLDDSFHSVVRAVEWGRSLYRNIQRFLFFQLVVNVTALLLVLGGSLIGTELPLTVTQILWVNLIMDTFAAMALASLPPSHEVMRQPPRRQTDFILLPSMCKGIVAIGLLFFAIAFGWLYMMERNGITPTELTQFFTTFVMLQWWNLFNARALGSKHSAFRHLHWCRGFLLVLAFILVGQWLIVEWGGQMFRTVPLSANDWLYIILGTSPVLWIGELYRLACRHAKR